MCDRRYWELPEFPQAIYLHLKMIKFYFEFLFISLENQPIEKKEY